MSHLFLRTSQNYGGTCQVCALPVPRTDTCQVCDLPVPRTDICGCVDPRTSENFNSFVALLECCIQQVLATLVRGTVAATLQTQSRENNGTALWYCTFRGHCVGCYCIYGNQNTLPVFLIDRCLKWQLTNVNHQWTYADHSIPADQYFWLTDVMLTIANTLYTNVYHSQTLSGP